MSRMLYEMLSTGSSSVHFMLRKSSVLLYARGNGEPGSIEWGGMVVVRWDKMAVVESNRMMISA